MEVATGAMGTLLPKLGELLQEEYNLQMSVKQRINDLKAELDSIQADLVKVSNLPVDQLDRQVKEWAGDVRELSYAIEDCLDSSMVRIKDLEPTKPSTIIGFIKTTLSNITELKARHEIANIIKRIESQVRKVNERYDRYKINDVISNVATTIDPRLSTLYNKVSNLVGTDEAIDELMKMLSKTVDMSENNLKAISVVGFGGLGKTTLTKALYDKLIKKFDCGGFVPVGQNPDIKKILRDILHELDKGKYRNITSSQMDARQLIDELKGFLVNKRYLIVIDDIWDIPAWEVIKCALVDSNPESRIIITTRIHEVATKVGDVYNMKPLSDDNSERLFSTRIWGSRDISSDNPSANVSDKILRKCGGVPLSIITIASLLVGKRHEDWSQVYDSIGFGHEDNEVVNSTRKILSFSYYDLPSHLKTCLLHLSIFPEDHLINKIDLIWMWIGEGFVPCEQGLRLFDLGESYFNQLVNRSMIRLIENSDGYKFDECVVHDIVLDLIRNLSSKLNFIQVLDIDQEPNICWPNKSISIRRLAVHRRRAEHNPVNMDMGHVRSFNATLCSDSRLLQLLSFKVLRVLFLNNCDFSRGDCNLEHLGKLVHLRFLGLVNTRVIKLPMEIGHDLKFLQILDVMGSSINKLPSSVAEMSKLMCLRAGRNTRTSARIGMLTSLEELQLYSVDNWPYFLTELRNLTELRLLELHFNVMDERVNKALVESLCNLRRIKVLKVASDTNMYYDDGAWEDWTPPLEIRELSVRCTCLPKCPSWIYSSYFPYLAYLKFQVVVAKEDDLHILGRLPTLRYLWFHADDTCLAHTVVSHEFPKLRNLDTNLEVIFDAEGGELPMLEELVCSISVGNQDVCGLVPGNMPLLQRVTYWLDCSGFITKEVEEAERALRHAATELHPNRPTIYIEREHYEVSHADEEQENVDFFPSPFLYDDNEDSDSFLDFSSSQFLYDDNEDSDSDEEVSVTGQEYDDNENSDSDEKVLVTGQEDVKPDSDMTYPVNNIKKATSCKLLARLQCGDGIEAARGLAYPTEERASIDGQLIERENAKVTVQHVQKVFEPMKLMFHLNNEITLLGHTQGRDIQWPRRDIIVDEDPSASFGDDTLPEKNEEAERDTTLLHELPSTTEAHETSVCMPLTQEAHQQGAMLLAENSQKKTVGKRKRSTNK